MTLKSAIYEGQVVHKRLRPVAHELSYHVASLFVDVDALRTHQLPALLSFNRFNLFSIHDSDHGDGGTISDFAWEKVRSAGLADEVASIFMLCYPRILGFAFNPLTAYYAVDRAGHVRLMIYEVHNTFGGRHTYVSNPIGPGGAAWHVTEKTFRVSPFNGVEGSYGLRATTPGENLTLGVALSTNDGPLLKAWFRARRRPLTNFALLGLFVRLPFQTLKVVGGIRWEALKLWLKGLNLYPS
jgi:uncharacterized protein